MQKTSCILLCSGTSSRMHPLSDKIFFTYLGKTILEWQIENILQQKNINKIFLVGNTKNHEKIQKIVESKFDKQKEKFFYTIQKEQKEGMKGGVLSVEKIFPNNDSALIMSSNDIVENWFLEDFLSEKPFPQVDVKICGKKVEKYFPGGYIEIDSEKNVKSIIEKPGAGNEPSDMINLVFHWFKNTSEFFSLLKNKNNSNDDAYEQTLQLLFSSEKTCKAIEYTGQWKSLKYPWHHLDMMDFFLGKIEGKNISKDAYISENVSISGDVIIESGVKIFDFAVISGPVFIGKNTIIGNHSLVRESSIGEDCCIGHSTEIVRSYLRDSVFTHQSYIGDSVIESNVNFGAGCRTGNLRHDKKNIEVFVKNKKINSGKNKLGIFCGNNVQFGINTSFFPGILIGSDSQLFPNITINKNIPNTSFVKPFSENTTLDIRENTQKNI
jgi:bifunctional UDP-N-acetylglucosamine pyrophosphorylase/glucosamine-1-phosphate N-acetyltransferase